MVRAVPNSNRNIMLTKANSTPNTIHDRGLSWLNSKDRSNNADVPFSFISSNNRFNYVIKFVNDLRQVGGFVGVLLFPPPIKLTAMI